MSDLPKELYVSLSKTYPDELPMYIPTEIPLLPDMETKYIRADEHEALRKSHAELVKALSDLKDASKSSGYPHEAIKRAEQAISEAEKLNEVKHG